VGGVQSKRRNNLLLVVFFVAISDLARGGGGFRRSPESSALPTCKWIIIDTSRIISMIPEKDSTSPIINIDECRGRRKPPSPLAPILGG